MIKNLDGLYHRGNIIHIFSVKNDENKLSFQSGIKSLDQDDVMDDPKQVFRLRYPSKTIFMF